MAEYWWCTPKGIYTLHPCNYLWTSDLLLPPSCCSDYLGEYIYTHMYRLGAAAVGAGAAAGVSGDINKWPHRLSGSNKSSAPGLSVLCWICEGKQKPLELKSLVYHIIWMHVYVCIVHINICLDIITPQIHSFECDRIWSRYKLSSWHNHHHFPNMPLHSGAGCVFRMRILNISFNSQLET